MMNTREILNWLRQSDPRRLDELWAAADRVRRQNVGDEVHLRGLIEISSHCARRCLYCGLRSGRAEIPRYRMTNREILDCVALLPKLGCRTVVLQAGEDPLLTQARITELIEGIRASHARDDLAITLSLGERSEAELAAWKTAGADRYLLRFETSDRALFNRIHPPAAERPGDRIALLGVLRHLGYQVGSGVMIGIPGQTCDSLARDIELFGELDLDMIGVGPFIPHPDTPLGAVPGGQPDGDQVPATEEMTYKVLALARLTCPRANIPSTTALATINRVDGREKGLRRGANVVMPNCTPSKYRRLYEIYPDKACITEEPADCHACLAGRIGQIGRKIGAGRGDARRSPAAPAART
jgi:biotin synthase